MILTPGGVPVAYGSTSAAFDLATAFLGQPKTLAYGLVRGAGNLVFQQQFPNNSIVAIYLLGEGPWDSLLRLWINDVAITLPNSSQVHVHNGFDGEIGFGMGAVSTGGDQHVDSFFGLPGMPATLSTITWGRYAYLALNYPPNPLAPSGGLTVLADYQAMRCRIFDASGNQIGFQWTQNPAWWICDFLIRKFILREAKVNQPLVAAELARFDWTAWVAAANYYDALIPSGVPRFSDGGLVFLQGGMSASNALEQMLLMCQSYMLERNGKLSLYPDQPRASVFTATTDTIVPGSFQAYKKTNLRPGKNRITATWREENLASGSTDNGTRMAIATRQFDHTAHQMAIGARGPGLSVMPQINELALDFGINTSERVSRLVSFQLFRQFGLDTDPNLVYNAPFEAELVCYEDSLAVEPGDVITLDPSLSEEFGSKQVEVLQVEERPDGTRKFICLEYIAGAFGDTALPRQAMQAPSPGTGLTLSQQQAMLGIYNGHNLLANPGFEFNSVNAPLTLSSEPGTQTVGDMIADDWYLYQISGAPGPFHSAHLYSGTVVNSGSKALLLRLNTGVTIPSDNVQYIIRAQYSGKIPVRAGDIMRVSGYVIVESQAGAPANTFQRQGIALDFYDANDNNIGEIFVDRTNPGAGGSYVLMQSSILVPATFGGTPAAYCRVNAFLTFRNNSGSAFSTGSLFYFDAFFDDMRLITQSTAFDLTPINTAGIPTTTNLCTQSGTSTTINIAGSSIQFGDGIVAYNSGSVNPGAYGTWFIYADDPTYSGGAVTYIATNNRATLTAANGRILFGVITTAGGGGGGSGTSGGAGSCFSGNTLVQMAVGVRRIDELKAGDLVITHEGILPIRDVLVHEFDGILLDMGGGELVTRDHLILTGRGWLPAIVKWRDEERFRGLVYNLQIDTQHEAERNYLLANGTFAHNTKNLSF